MTGSFVIEECVGIIGTTAGGKLDDSVFIVGREIQNRERTDRAPVRRTPGRYRSWFCTCFGHRRYSTVSLLIGHANLQLMLS